MPTKPLQLNNKSIAKITSIPKINSAIDMLDIFDLLKEYKYTCPYKGRIKESCLKKDENYVWFSWTNRKKPVKLKRFIPTNGKLFESLCRLLGAYIAEGSSSTKETTKRKGASISCGDVQWLEQLQKDFYSLFVQTKASIIRSSLKKERIIKIKNGESKYEDKTYKLQMMNEIAAIFFKMLCGQKSKFKKMPQFIFNVENKYKMILLNNMIKGDGSREKKKCYSKEYRERHFRYDTKSLLLISGISLLMTQLGFCYSIQYRDSKQTYRIISSNKNNVRLSTKVKQIEYNDYLYDISVEDNHIFSDACGLLLLHNTDSIFILSDKNNYEDAEELGNKLQTIINNYYKNEVQQKYKKKSVLELEFDKVYRRFILPKVRGQDVGAKKRYAGLLIEDNKEQVNIVGLEFVRRDWTELSKIFQMELLDRIFHDREVQQYIKDFVKELLEGKHNNLLVYRKAIRKEVEDYTKTTPPHIKAARILGEQLSSNIIEYVITTEGPEPLQKQTHKIDYQHYIDKQLKPIADSILCFFNTSFDELTQKTAQKTLFNY